MDRILPPSSGLVYPFDFQLPHQLPRAAQDAMMGILIAWARLVGSSLTPRVTLPALLAFDHAEQQTFAEILPQWTSPFVFVPFNGTLPGVIACDVPVARLIAYRLMGGSEDIGVTQEPVLTDFEQNLWLRQVSTLFHEGFRKMWAPVLPMEQVWDTVYFEPAFLSTRIQDADWVFTAHFTWTIGSLAGKLMWVWTLADLAPLASLLAAHIHPQQGVRRRPDEPQTGWRERVRRLDVPVTVELGTYPLRITDLLQLSAGQTLVLRTRVTDTLPIRVASLVKGYGAPGAIDGHYAVQVASMLDDADTDTPGPETAPSPESEEEWSDAS